MKNIYNKYFTSDEESQLKDEEIKELLNYEVAAKVYLCFTIIFVFSTIVSSIVTILWFNKFYLLVTILMVLFGLISAGLTFLMLQGFGKEITKARKRIRGEMR